MNVFCKSTYLTISLFLFVGQAVAVESFQSSPQVQGPENFAQKPVEMSAPRTVGSPASELVQVQENDSNQGPKLTDLDDKVSTIESDLQEVKNRLDLLEALNSKVDSLAADVGSLKISGTSVDGKASAQDSVSTISPDATLPAKPARFAATTDQGSTTMTSNSPEQSDQTVVAPASDNSQKPEDLMGFGSSVFATKPSPVDVGVSPVNLDLTSTPTITNETSFLESQSVIKSDALPI